MKKEPKTFITREGIEAVEVIDFYVENGYYVFTAAYLLKRGYCCQSGCRHCPYGFDKKLLEKQKQKRSSDRFPD